MFEHVIEFCSVLAKVIAPNKMIVHSVSSVPSGCLDSSCFPRRSGTPGCISVR